MPQCLHGGLLWHLLSTSMDTCSIYLLGALHQSDLVHLQASGSFGVTFWWLIRATYVTDEQFLVIYFGRWRGQWAYMLLTCGTY